MNTRQFFILFFFLFMFSYPVLADDFNVSLDFTPSFIRFRDNASSDFPVILSQSWCTSQLCYTIGFRNVSLLILNSSMNVTNNNGYNTLIVLNKNGDNVAEFINWTSEKRVFTWNNATAQHNISLYYNDTNGVTGCEGGHTILRLYDCLGNPIYDVSKDTGDVVNGNWLAETNKYDSYNISTNITYFCQFAFLHQLPSVAPYSICFHQVANVTFKDVLASEIGDVPKINTSSVDASCFNTTTQNAVINISLYGSELTNNIYYSVSDFKTLVESVDYLEDFVDTSSGECKTDRTFFNSNHIFNGYNSSTYYTYSIELCTYYGTFVPAICEISSSVINGDTQTCNGVLDLRNTFLPFYFLEGTVFNQNSTYTENFKVANDNEYHLNFKDSSAVNIINITANQTNDGNLSLIINDSVVLNVPTDSRYVVLKVNFNYDLQQVNITLILNQTILYRNYTYSVNFTDFYSVEHFNYGHITLYPNVKIEYFHFEGVSTTDIINDWTLLNLVNGSGNVVLNTDYKGSRYINLYITDLFHKSLNQWNKYVFFVDVQTCGEDLTLRGDTAQALKAIKALEFETCSIFNGLFSSASGGVFPIQFCTLLAWVVMIVVFAFAVGFIITLNSYVHVDIYASMLVGGLFWSVVCLLLSFVVYFTNDIKVLIGIVFALSFIGFIIRVFFSESSSSGGGVE